MALTRTWHDHKKLWQCGEGDKHCEVQASHQSCSSSLLVFLSAFPIANQAVMLVLAPHYLMIEFYVLFGTMLVGVAITFYYPTGLFSLVFHWII